MKIAKKPSVTVRKAAKTALSHIESRKNSKLSVEQYCKLHKIGKSTFYNWVKRYGNLAAEVAFVPLIPNPPNKPVASTPHKSFGIKIDMPQGMVLHIAADSDCRSVIRFIKELATWS